WCDLWLYGPDRRLFEIYNKSLNIVPIAELPHHRVSWDRHLKAYEQGILAEQADVARNILQRIANEGPLSTAAFSEHNASIDWWWAPTRAARAVLEALFVTGRVGVARRDGNRRYYDLVERLVPEHILKQRESFEEGMLHRLLSRYRAAGLTRPSASQEVIVGTGTGAERAQRTQTLVERGLLIPVKAEGLKQVRYIVTEDRASLAEAAAGHSDVPPAVSFVAPLDPVMWDRQLLKELWGFDYVWEVYVPEPKRRWGYYVLPILFGDEFVGRIEPRFDRASRTLRILGLWWEQGFERRHQEAFVAAMRDALTAYMQFVGARKIEWLRAAAHGGRDFGSPRP
ncbi:MAG: crosslink repair DNA glycosylase YcaQ family protein, partial [Candidatus Limnocylindrales bacterium]